METSEFNVEDFINMLKEFPKDAKLFIKYSGYYEGFGGPCRPHLDGLGRVVVGEVEADY